MSDTVLLYWLILFFFCEDANEKKYVYFTYINIIIITLSSFLIIFLICPKMFKVHCLGSALCSFKKVQRKIWFGFLFLPWNCRWLPLSPSLFSFSIPSSPFPPSRFFLLSSFFPPNPMKAHINRKIYTPDFDTFTRAFLCLYLLFRHFDKVLSYFYTSSLGHWHFVTLTRYFLKFTLWQGTFIYLHLDT